MTPFALVLLATLQANYQPAEPRVGDPVKVTYDVASGQSVEVAAGEAYEVISRSADGAVVRSFRPGPFVIQGTLRDASGQTPLRGPEIKVGSVLGPEDDLKPAPLIPPKPIPRPAYVKQLVWGAAGFAALAWIALLALAKFRRARPAGAEIESDFDYGALVRQLRGRALTQPDIARLADATRRHLALGMELTTSELLDSISSDERRAPAAREILRHGDLAKFAPWGSPEAGSDRLAVAAETLIAKEGADASLR